jgi:hypothetical protein
MYGDMGALQARAAGLRGMADEVRGRAATLVQQADAMSWNSTAGDALRGRMQGIAAELGAQAQGMDDAALNLETHIRSVNEVKSAIAAAERVVADSWDRAKHIATNAIEVAKDVLHSSVSGMMRVIGAVATGDPTKIRVAVFTLAGHDISHEAVAQAKSVVRTVPALPASGSKDWLDLNQTFTSQGWTG